MKQWPVPKNATEIWGFIGLASYYRKFIRNFPHLATPLLQLTRKDVKFDWPTACQLAFETLQNVLTLPPLLSFPDFEKEFILFTDASLDATGAVLSQLRNGKEVVIAYASHTFTRPERNWATYDKELYTIVWAVRHFRHYLASSPFIIYTVHKPLVGLRKIPIQNDSTGRRARWASDMDMYQWRIQYCPGKKNGNADAMYRIPGTHMANDEMELPNDEDDIVLSVNNLFQIPRVMQHQGNRKHPSTKVLNRVPTNPMLKILCLQGRHHEHTHTHIHARTHTHTHQHDCKGYDYHSNQKGRRWTFWDTPWSQCVLGTGNAEAP